MQKLAFYDTKPYDREFFDLMNPGYDILYLETKLNAYTARLAAGCQAVCAFVNDTVDAAFQCDCSKERVSRAIATLSRKDLDDIVSDGESIEVKCQFCNKAYHFDIDELKEMRK